MNFLKETKIAIKDSGHKIKDVMFIGSSDGKLRLDFNAFAKIANFNYDEGFGSQEIAKDLIIYFNDETYIVRGEYDGSIRNISKLRARSRGQFTRLMKVGSPIGVTKTNGSGIYITTVTLTDLKPTIGFSTSTH